MRDYSQKRPCGCLACAENHEPLCRERAFDRWRQANPGPDAFRKRNRAMVRLRKKGMQYKDIAERYGVSRERVTQIVNRLTG